MTLEIFPIQINKEIKRDEKLAELIISSSKQKIKDIKRDLEDYTPEVLEELFIPTGNIYDPLPEKSPVAFHSDVAQEINMNMNKLE